MLGDVYSVHCAVAVIKASLKWCYGNNLDANYKHNTYLKSCFIVAFMMIINNC